MASSLRSYIPLIRWVSEAVSPAKTPTPMMEIIQSSPLDLKKMLTKLAITMPITPINRNVPNPDRSRWVV